MVTQGLKRLTPTHIQALTRKYRKALGELQYHERRLLDATEVRGRIEALAEALRICAPALNLSEVAPIRYQPPAPLSTAALTRQVLAGLRRGAGSLDSLVQEVMATAVLPDVPENQAWLRKRIPMTLRALQTQGLVTLTPGGWVIQAPSASVSR